MKSYRPYSPSQSFLLPPSPLEWLPKGHLAYFVLEVVGQLDLSPIFSHYEREERGYPPYHPQMMTALLLYSYCVGVVSSRRIEKRTHEDVAFRVVAGGQQPDHTRISEFRRVHLAVFERLFIDLLRLCQAKGLVKLGHVAVDGTKMKANASKHKAMSYERMVKREAELKAKVAAILEAAEAADVEEDGRYGAGRRGDELPEELKTTEGRLKWIQEAKAALEAEAQQAKAEEEARDAGEKEDDRDEPPPLPKHRVPHDAEGKPTPKAQRNFTDPESRIQKTSDGFIQGYNCQAAVDEGHQIIVAQAVTNQPPDVEHFGPMLSQLVAHCGGAPKQTTADAGYFSAENVALAERIGTDPFIATERKRHQAGGKAAVESPTKEETPKERMAFKLASERGHAIYARRKATVEPVFGQIKHARGLRQFLLKGLAKVRGEWALICMTHNLLKLHRAATA